MPTKQVFLIAEIGINHNGDIDLAKRMIADAADAGFDAIKLQKRSIDCRASREASFASPELAISRFQVPKSPPPKNRQQSASSPSRPARPLSC